MPVSRRSCNSSHSNPKLHTGKTAYVEHIANALENKTYRVGATIPLPVYRKVLEMRHAISLAGSVTESNLISMESNSFRTPTFSRRRLYNKGIKKKRIFKTGFADDKRRELAIVHANSNVNFKFFQVT